MHELGNLEPGLLEPFAESEEVMTPRTEAEPMEERLYGQLCGLFGGEARPVV